MSAAETECKSAVAALEGAQRKVAGIPPMAEMPEVVVRRPDRARGDR